MITIHPDEWRKLCGFHHRSGQELFAVSLTTQLLIFLATQQPIAPLAPKAITFPSENEQPPLLNNAAPIPITYFRYNQKNLTAAFDIAANPQCLALSLRWLCVIGYLYLSESTPPDGHSWDLWVDWQQIKKNLILSRNGQLFLPALHAKAYAGL
jgi:hypothetical protein